MPGTSVITMVTTATAMMTMKIILTTRLSFCRKRIIELFLSIDQGGIFPYHDLKAPHISPSFGEMWELTGLEPEALRRNWHFRAGNRQFPHLAKRGRDMGCPEVVVRKNSQNKTGRPRKRPPRIFKPELSPATVVIRVAVDVRPRIRIDIRVGSRIAVSVRVRRVARRRRRIRRCWAVAWRRSIRASRTRIPRTITLTHAARLRGHTGRNLGRFLSGNWLHRSRAGQVEADQRFRRNQTTGSRSRCRCSQAHTGACDRTDGRTRTATRDRADSRTERSSTHRAARSVGAFPGAAGIKYVGRQRVATAA